MGKGKNFPCGLVYKIANAFGPPPGFDIYKGAAVLPYSFYRESNERIIALPKIIFILPFFNFSLDPFLPGHLIFPLGKFHLEGNFLFNGRRHDGNASFFVSAPGIDLKPSGEFRGSLNRVNRC